MSELKPCPKCETNNGMKFIGQNLQTKKWTVKCLHCGYTTLEQKAKYKAVIAWNTRKEG